ncbi:inositol monophosphatase [Patescibacteria group bacterium]|nr:inositol monophosphatase [Patescibacteria group bacterium]
MYKEFAIKIVKKAGQELLKYFSRIDKMKVSKKSKHEIVTPADLVVNKIIMSAIKKQFPTHGILSEETGFYQKGADYLWVIDPLDGTTNFSIGNHFFNVSIALIYKNEIILGVILAPFFKQLFVAEKNKGVYLNNIKIKVSNSKKSINSMIDFGYTYKDDKSNQKMAYAHAQFLFKFEHAHNLGAAALELAWVALGRLEAYVLPHTKPWDIAAGVLMIKEAGGKVTDFKNKEYKFTTNEKGNLIASNGKIHKELVEILKKW